FLMMLLAAGMAGVSATVQPPRLNGTFLPPDFGLALQLRLLSQVATGLPHLWWLGVPLLIVVMIGLLSGIGSSTVSTTWLLIGAGGVLCGEWVRRIAFRSVDIGFVLPPYLLLAAAGLGRLRQLLLPRAGTFASAAGRAAALALLLVIALPGL